MCDELVHSRALLHLEPVLTVHPGCFRLGTVDGRFSLSASLRGPISDKSKERQRGNMGQHGATHALCCSVLLGAARCCSVPPGAVLSHRRRSLAIVRLPRQSTPGKTANAAVMGPGPKKANPS